MVTSSGGTLSASTTKTVLGGGSSMVFSNMGPTVWTRCRSASTSTLRDPSTGLRMARRMISSPSSRRRNAPWGV
jgi:hypothetical protein